MKLNYELQNKEEEYFFLWLKELQSNGYIDYIKPDQITFQLFPRHEVHWDKKLKTKISIKSFNLFNESVYTPDFCFKFSHKARNILSYSPNKAVDARKIFIDINTSGAIYVDVKGGFEGKFKSSMIFPDRKAIMWNVHNKYIHKIKPFVNKTKSTCLFAKTFTPKKVIAAEVYKIKSKRGQSKLKFETRSLNEFINK